MMTDPCSFLQELTSRFPCLLPMTPEITAAGQVIGDALAADQTLYLCGNGGSAADCEHIAGELLKGFLVPRRLPASDRERLVAAAGVADGDYLAAKLQGALRAVALTRHPALATAVGNDTGGDLVFAQQVWGLGRPGDVLLAISTSGNARNAVLAAKAALAREMTVIALTGNGGGALRSLAHVVLAVPERETFRVQELHLPVYHCLCAMLEARFFTDRQ